MILTLRHTGGSTKTVQVVGCGSVAKEPSLIIRWGFNSYDLLLQTNRLVYAQTNRRITRAIPFWSAQDINEAWSLYNGLSPGLAAKTVKR